MPSYRYSRHITQFHKPLRAHRPPLRPSQWCKRRGERSGTRGDAVVLHSGSGSGGGRVMSLMDSHDYHFGHLPFFSAYFPSFRPSILLLSSLRPLGLFPSVIMRRCIVSWYRPSLAVVHKAGSHSSLLPSVITLQVITSTSSAQSMHKSHSMTALLLLPAICFAGTKRSVVRGGGG